ncbi:MAG: hypothetical protein WCT15_03185 [Candidatus Omnitrophota bacterium]
MDKKLSFAYLLMGFTSLAVQTILIREFFITFNGNELTIGMVLASWILLVALGSAGANRLSQRSAEPRSVYAMLQLGIACSLPVSIFLVRMVKNMLGITVGEGVGIPVILLSSLIIPILPGILTGMQFPFGSRLLRNSTGQAEGSSGKVYLVESIGFIIAGAVITYSLITRFDSFSIAAILALVNAISAMTLLTGSREVRSAGYIRAFIAALFIVALFSLFGPAQRLHQFSLDKQWKGQKLLSYRNSVYGNLAAAKSNGQYTFYSNGLPIITTPLPDITATEELAHFSMLAHPDPKKVLLIGGGAGGMINEILKYNIEKLTYIELDPSLIRMVKDFPTTLTEKELHDGRLDIKNMDGRRFLNMTKDVYDVVIVNLPIPSTLELNRFYTAEFFRSARSSLSERGLVTYTLPGSLSYLGTELRNLNGVIMNAAKEELALTAIPGYTNIYLASKKDAGITPDILFKRLSERNIETKTINRLYLEDRLDLQWIKWFQYSMSRHSQTRKNSDIMPIGAYYAVSYWNALFSPGLNSVMRLWDKLNFAAFAAAILVCGVLLYMSLSFVPDRKKYSTALAIFTTGFVTMCLNLILIYAYQSFFGFVFSDIAMLVAAFMAGLAAGSFLTTRAFFLRRDGVSALINIEGASVIFSLSLGGLLLLLNNSRVNITPLAFYPLLGAAGFFVGAEFPIANRIYLSGKGPEDAGGFLYAMDLLGSWLAAIFVSAVLMPLIGIFHTCLLLGMIKLTSFAVVVKGRKN